MEDKWVLYDVANNSFVRYLLCGAVRLFDSENDAIKDMYGNEIAIKVSEIPKRNRDVITESL